MEITIRPATQHDLKDVIALLADDELGGQRESVSEESLEYYVTAFHRIKEDANHELVVMVSDNREIVGTLQLTFLQYLSYQGGIKALIEDVRIKRAYRNKGLGTTLVDWACKRAKTYGAHQVQLTSHLSRKKAIAFYEKVGFEFSHAGMKKIL